MKADILRDKFLDFFKSKKHKIIESDSLVPADDPTVLFTPAGMNQFKKEFMGLASGFTRAATAQRCLRTDDLDRVGKTRGHHTLFEMLGNFSFGNYFKEEAISWAWEFLSEELKIKKERLWVSVYRDDEEAYRIWKDKIKIPAAKIIELGDKENFWPSEAKEKGPNGPCGPCSEIFFDQGESVGCRKPDCNPACDCDRFVEAWNLVFTQFNRKDGGILEPLPKKNIDTGMGLERLAAVMQGVLSNFETDLFKPLIDEIVSSVRCQVSGVNKELSYAIADHLRAISFAIYDGVLPSNEARGYIVRKLIRKSTLHLRTLGFKQPFLYKLVPVLSQIMQRPYPELAARKEDIAAIILSEEENFISILNSSNDLFKEKFQELINRPHPERAGEIAFCLYDTYGIPLELTKGWLDQHNIKISQESFQRELSEQKTRSKLQSAMKGNVFQMQELHLDIQESKFVGDKEYSTRAKIIKIIKNNTEAKQINKGEEAIIVLDKTSFYPEAGGQIGDKGEIVKGKNIFVVLDTQKKGKAIIHLGQLKAGSFKKSDAVMAKINLERRLAIARNHTATHLLQAALRKVLGPHVKQQGSLVAEDRLRFDFTHFKDIEKEQLDRIEEIVNNYILNSYSLNAKVMSLPEAKKQGALAFFVEKYAKRVRMVSIGDFSRELCGGTHLSSTGQIGLFKITQEGSVASGVRRIEAVTGIFAYQLMKKEEDKLAQEIQTKALRIKTLEKQINSQKADSLKNSLENFMQNAEIINDIKIITGQQEGLNMDLLRRSIDLIKQKTNNSVIALGSVEGGRALLVMGITEDLVQKGLDATKLILNVAGILGGSGGGRKDFAQAGGNKPENFAQAFQELKNQLSNLK